MLKEFKEFALKGNAMELAVGVIVANAFQGIAKSLVNDIITPFISIFTGQVNFSDLSFNIGNATIKYGSFITTIIDFIILAFSVFLFIRYFNKIEKLTLTQVQKINKEIEKKMPKNNYFINKFQKKKATVVDEPTTKICPYCLTEINIKATRCPNCTSELNEKK